MYGVFKMWGWQLESMVCDLPQELNGGVIWRLKTEWLYGKEALQKTSNARSHTVRDSKLQAVLISLIVIIGRLWATY